MCARVHQALRFRAQSLAETAPAEALAAFRAPLEAALAAGPQDEDRPRACAAAEVFSGLLASGALVLDTGAYTFSDLT